jgi:hypothetical protein
MKIPDELLAAYLDGELQGAERARIEQALQQDKRLAQRLSKQRALRARSRLDAQQHQEPMSQRLTHFGRSITGTGSAQVIDLARVRAERKRRSERSRNTLSRRILLLATGVFGGMVFGVLIARFSRSGGLTEYRDGALLARGVLADALSEQLAASPASGSVVRIGLSFKTRTGGYCRTFSVRDTQTLAGLACHEQNQWRVWTLDANAPRTTTVRTTRSAAGLPPALAQAVNDRISGAPLDSQAEISARRSGWR